MGKLTLKALGVLLKKAFVATKKYVDLMVSANSVHMFEKGTPNTGYLKTIIFTTATSLAAVTALNTIGEIDIPKEFFLTGKKLLTVEAGTGAYEGKFMVTKEDNVAVTAYEASSQVNSAGTWLDLVVNVEDASETAKHTLIDLTSFIDIYTNGNGIALENKVFSIKLKMSDNDNVSGLTFENDGSLTINIDPGNANGLAITSAGLKLALATASTNGAGGSAGAMSAVDKEHLDGLVDDMDLTLITDAEIASWLGFDITGTPTGADAVVKTALEGVSSDSITDEPAA